MRTTVSVMNVRRVLCVFPAYTPSFGTFSHAYKLMPGVRAFMPPQGLLLIAAYMPAEWPVRVIDENIQPASAADLAWADVVLVSGMHIQAAQIRDLARRAHAAGKVAALGGPSVSASPEMYPEIDYLHIGELGDATDALIARLDESVAPPAAQMRFETDERLALTDFPIPAYDLIALRNYLMLTLQFSSGCPYRCEFCDIPGLYGRQPRLKTPQQIIAELDAMRRQKDCPQALYFVDDNFIGNRKATREMLPHLIEWQRKHGYPIQFSCEATLTMNLLQALPKTPLWDRLAREGRLADDPALESNVRFLRPYDDVIGTWRRCVAHAYDPERLFARFAHQVEATYRNRMAVPARGRLTLTNLIFAARFAVRLAYHVGFKADYRRHFWRVAGRALRRGRIAGFFGIGF